MFSGGRRDVTSLGFSVSFILPRSSCDWFVHVGVKLINAIKNYVSGWKAPERLQEAIEDCLVGWLV